MPRLRRKSKRRSRIRIQDLNMPERVALTNHCPTLGGLGGAFKTIEDVESFYEDHKHLFETCTCEDGKQRGRWCERSSFCQRKPGNRPWVVWKFELGFDEVPENQAQVLEEIGALEPGEKRAI